MACLLEQIVALQQSFVCFGIALLVYAKLRTMLGS